MTSKTIQKTLRYLILLVSYVVLNSSCVYCADCLKADPLIIPATMPASQPSYIPYPTSSYNVHIYNPEPQSTSSQMADDMRSYQINSSLNKINNNLEQIKNINQSRMYLKY